MIFYFYFILFYLIFYLIFILFLFLFYFFLPCGLHWGDVGDLLVDVLKSALDALGVLDGRIATRVEAVTLNGLLQLRLELRSKARDLLFDRSHSTSLFLFVLRCEPEHFEVELHLAFLRRLCKP